MSERESVIHQNKRHPKFNCLCIKHLSLGVYDPCNSPHKHPSIWQHNFGAHLKIPEQDSTTSLKIQNIVGALSMVWASWPGMAYGWPLASATLRWPTTPATPTHLLARPLLGVGP